MIIYVTNLSELAHRVCAFQPLAANVIMAINGYSG